MAANHAIASFEFQTSLKVLPKMNLFIYDYNKGDFKGYALLYGQQTYRI